MLEQIQISLAKIALSLLAIQAAIAATIPNATYFVFPAENSTTEAIWAQAPALLRACSCESNGDPNKTPRQFNNDDGSVLWGNDRKIKGATTTDVGACQISLKYHETEARSRGLDIVNLYNDNVAYAKILYDREGLVPWNASRSCWR